MRGCWSRRFAVRHMNGMRNLVSSQRNPGTSFDRARGHSVPAVRVVPPESVIPRTQRRTVVLAALIVVGIFGPYTSLTSGVRYEHVVVYGAVVAMLPFTFLRLRVSAPFAGVIWLWTLIPVVSLIGLAVPPVNTTEYPSGRLLAELDNFCRPLAVMVLCLILLTGATRLALLRTVAAVVVAAMSVNAVLSLISVWVDLTWLLHWFWTNEVSAADAVMSPAETMGRFSGIFVMPAQAGAAYGIALLAAIWLFRKRMAWLVVIVSLIAFGGVLSVSKNFLFVGIPVFVINSLRLSGMRRPRRFLSLALGLAAAAELVGGGLLPTWGGREGLRYYTEPSGDLLRYYTAGRMGEGSDFDRVMGMVTSESPVYGFGANGLKVAVDGSWVQVIIMAGLLGLALLIGVIVIMVCACWSHRDHTPDSQFAQGLIVLAIGTSFGIPVFTTARVASFLWLLICLSVLSCGPRSRSGRSHEGSFRARVAFPRRVGHVRSVRTGCETR